MMYQYHPEDYDEPSFTAVKLVNDIPHISSNIVEWIDDHKIGYIDCGKVIEAFDINLHSFIKANIKSEITQKILVFNAIRIESINTNQIDDLIRHRNEFLDKKNMGKTYRVAHYVSKDLPDWILIFYSRKEK